MARTANAATVPRDFNVENTLMRRTHRFDHCVTRRGAAFGLKFFLKHGFVVCLRGARSEEHTSELQSQSNLVCRLLLEKKNQPLHVLARRKLASQLVPG